MNELAGRIYLGSVQWGLPYGIANTTGQPSILEVEKILGIAASAGIRGIDTAYSYGDAESAIGQLEHSSLPFLIVTKTLPLRQARITRDHVSQARDAFHQSLRRLRRDRVYGLLVHHSADLSVPGGDLLWEMMDSLRREGAVTRIGASVYSPRDLTGLSARYPLQVVQVPANIYDQRFLRGLLDPLRAAGCEVHARSAFLQGLLLQPPAELSPHFSPIQSHQQELISYVRSAGHSITSAAIHFVLNQDCVDRVVVGFEQAFQLKEILAVLDEDQRQEPLSLAPFAIEREDILNPSLWAIPS